jgi:hypothetical protein
MMNVVQAVTGNRLVPTIFIRGQIVPGGGSGLKHLGNLWAARGDIRAVR